MPGAPWRSQGCNTCRRRKVKCDGERPHCARCLRGGHRCEGYDRSRKFVHAFSAPETTSKNLPVTKRQPRKQDAGFTTINVNTQIRSQLFSLFIDSYIPSRPLGHINFRCQPASNLFEVFPTVMNGRNSQLLDRAISALAAVFVGNKVGNEQLIRHGVGLYNNAIQVFARLIPRSGLPVQEVLCANVVFQLYELINCTSGFSGWTAHMEGANAVLARHEQFLERDELTRMLLRQLRLSNIFHAIGKSKSALAFCPMWRLLSPKDSDDPIDEIIDILMACTSLLEQMDDVRSTSDAEQLMHQSWDLNMQTMVWYDKLESIHGKPLYTKIPDETSVPRSQTSRNILPERYEFSALEVAESHMLCWTAMLIMYSIFHRLEVQKEQLHPGYTTDNEEAEIFLKGAQHYATQICLGVSYFLQPHMHILGGHNLLFPVSMASQLFHINGLHDQYQWCQEVFAALEATGLGLASVLQGTPWSRYKQISGPTPVAVEAEDSPGEGDDI